MPPLVSISCITYNHAPYIRQCFEGFLKQETDFLFEIVIHDDASTDGTKEIIEEYRDKYPYIFFPIIQKENQYSKGIRGFTAKYNFPRCRGKYIALCEGDDYWTDPNKLQKQIDFLEQNSEYVLTSHDAVIVNETGELISDSKLTENYKTDYDSTELKQSSFVLTLTMCFKNIPIFKNMPNEFYKVDNGDSFLISMLGQYGKHKFMSTIQPAVYRIHANGVWSMISEVEKNKKKINTLFQLRNYYSRLRDKKMEIYYGKIIALISTKLLLNSFKEKHSTKNKIRTLYFYFIYNRILLNPVAYFKRLRFLKRKRTLTN